MLPRPDEGKRREEVSAAVPKCTRVRLQSPEHTFPSLAPVACAAYRALLDDDRGQFPGILHGFLAWLCVERDSRHRKTPRLRPAVRRLCGRRAAGGAENGGGRPEGVLQGAAGCEVPRQPIELASGLWHLVCGRGDEPAQVGRRREALYFFGRHTNGEESAGEGLTSPMS
jgi:hypothetical protein